MGNFGVYGELGFFHVMDPAGYDHVLFLIALALPFSLALWKRVFWLATLFTVSHCLSLALAAFGIISFDSAIVEFLIPITILLTALFDLFLAREAAESGSTFKIHLIATGLFGLIHGLGFSNYFGMLMSGESEKTGPLFGFALGIELAQLLVLSFVLALSYIILERIQLNRTLYIRISASIIVIISAALTIKAWP